MHISLILFKNANHKIFTGNFIINYVDVGRYLHSDQLHELRPVVVSGHVHTGPDLPPNKAARDAQTHQGT